MAVYRLRRVAARGVVTVVAGIALVTTVTTESAQGAGTAGRSGGSAGLTDPSAGHPYRHGAVPLITGVPVPSTSAATKASSPFRGQGHPFKGLMSFGGGYPPQGGGGAVTSQEKVYLVLWGSQWGTQSTSGGYQVFSGDPLGIAPDLEAFFSGLGTNNELWSAVATQYCDGIAAGSVSCPVSASHVAYPSGGVLAGVWEDTSATPATGSPGSTTTPAISGAAIAQEAANAATFFGDTTPSAQYVIMSPPGTNPDNWTNPQTGFCAYHDSTGDGLGVVGPDVAYTNFPYVTDGRCWQGTVNSPGTLDGVTIIEGHEYYETITDPFFSPKASGWTDTKNREIGDKCLGLNAGLPGAPINLTLATGSFAVQGMWSNDSKKGKGDCAVSHSPILMTTPAKQRTKALSPFSVQIGALDVRGLTLGYSAVGLPAGVSINAGSGLISGTPASRGHTVVTVTASDGTNSASVSFKWTVRR